MQLPKHLCPSAGVLAAAVCTSFLLPQARALSLDFANSTDLTGNFETDAVYSHSTGTGVGGVNGRVNIADTTGATLGSTASFNLTGGNSIFTGSVYFKLANFNPPSGNNVVTLGLMPDTASVLTNTANSSVAFRIFGKGTNGYTLRVESVLAGGSITTLNSAASLTLNSTDVYQLTGTITRSATSGVFELTTELFNMGANGLGTPVSIASTSGSTASIASLYSDSSLFLGIRAGGVSGTWIDNLNASAIPEPSSFALFAGMGGLALASLRRRSRRS